MIPSKRYIVELHPDQAQTLSPEHLDLATCLDGAAGNRLLIYRDNFIAYKVATLTGGTVCLGRVVTDTTREGALTLDDGTLLVLEGPVLA